MDIYNKSYLNNQSVAPRRFWTPLRLYRGGLGRGPGSTYKSVRWFNRSNAYASRAYNKPGYWRNNVKRPYRSLYRVYNPYRPFPSYYGRGATQSFARGRQQYRNYSDGNFQLHNYGFVNRVKYKTKSMFKTAIFWLMFIFGIIAIAGRLPFIHRWAVNSGLSGNSPSRIA